MAFNLSKAIKRMRYVEVDYGTQILRIKFYTAKRTAIYIHKFESDKDRILYKINDATKKKKIVGESEGLALQQVIEKETAALCLLYASDIVLRVAKWDVIGLDDKPLPLAVAPIASVLPLPVMQCLVNRMTAEESDQQGEDMLRAQHRERALDGKGHGEER
jgi:hypothetical protein